MSSGSGSAVAPVGNDDIEAPGPTKTQKARKAAEQQDKMAGA